MEEQIKYYLEDNFKLSNSKRIGLFEYEIELFRANEDEPWSTQIEDLYTLLRDLEDTFEIVKLISMDINDNWYYVTIYIYTEEFAYA